MQPEAQKWGMAWVWLSQKLSDIIEDQILFHCL